MKKLTLALAAILATSLVRTSHAADKAESPTSTNGFKTDYLMLLDRAEREMVQLEQAVPEKKFSWRPSKDVRSVGEVYLHAAGAVYFLLGKAGREPPSDVKALMDAKKWETQTNSPAAVKEILTKSFAYTREALGSTSDADLEKKVDAFGRQVTVRSLYMAILDHFSEHLGQSIAYARMNGVVPPWSKKDK